MKFFKRKNLFLICSLIFVSQPLLAQSNDPCNDISGNWVGTWNSLDTGCTWKLEATGSIYQESITLQIHRYHGRPLLKCVHEQRFAMSGICKNGHIIFNTNRGIIEGPIQGGTIGLYGGDVNISFTRA